MRSERFYQSLKILLGWIFYLYYHPKMDGELKISKEYPLVIASNHRHALDPVLMGLAINRPIHFLAKKPLFDSKFGFLFRLVGCIPVKRDGKDHQALDSAIEVLKKGKVIGIYPEGTRNKVDKLLPFKFGAVKMAKESDAYIIPFAITGKYRFIKNKMVCHIGKTFKVGKMSLEEANKKLEREVNKLINKEEK